MKNLIVKTFICTAIIMTVGCAEQDALEKYNCKIVHSETMQSIKKSIYIQIPEQLTEEQLREIATQLRKKNRKFERLFILYYLPDMDTDDVAWATTHFNTELEIDILGADKNAEQMMKTIELPNGEIIGKWYFNTPLMEHSVIIYEVNGKYRMKETYGDGSSGESELQYSKVNGKSKFIYEWKIRSN